MTERVYRIRPRSNKSLATEKLSDDTMALTPTNLDQKRLSICVDPNLSQATLIDEESRSVRTILLLSVFDDLFHQRRTLWRMQPSFSACPIRRESKTWRSFESTII